MLQRRTVKRPGKQRVSRQPAFPARRRGPLATALCHTATYWMTGHAPHVDGGAKAAG